jgi:hypothetical protein
MGTKVVTLQTMVPAMSSFTTFTERFNQALQELGLRPADAARLTGISPQGIKKLVDGTSKAMRSEHAYTFAEKVGISYVWLTVGVGSMRETAAPFTQELMTVASRASHQDRRRAENAARVALDLPLLSAPETSQLAA